MMAAAHDLLIQLVRDCQADLAAYLPPDGVSAHETLSRLLGRLDGPQAREALAAIEADEVGRAAARERDRQFIAEKRSNCRWPNDCQVAHGKQCGC